MNKLIKYVITDILRNKIVSIYTLLLFIISFGVFQLDDTTNKGLLSLLNLVLFIVPLVSLIFSTIYLYNSAEFIELLVSQPLGRKSIWLSLYTGVAVSLSISFLLGTGIPILLYSSDTTGTILIIAGTLLTIIFVSLAFLATVLTRDKAKGMGTSIFIWLYFSLIFDGLVLFLLFQFADYPLEKIIVTLSTLNPIDLCRILILLQMDISALMGFTGAVFKNSFGTQSGLIFAFALLVLWALVPLLLSLKKFIKKDL